MNNIVLFNKENMERQMFATIDASTMENKAKLFNATENADVLANDCVGEKFTLVDAYIERIPTIDEETGDIKDPVIDLSGVEDIDAFKKNFLKFLDDGAWEELKKHIYTKNILNEAGEAISAGADINDLADAIRDYNNNETEDDLLTIWDNWTSVVRK